MVTMVKRWALLFAVFTIAIIMLISLNIAQFASSTTLNNLFGGDSSSSNAISVLSQTAYIDRIGSFHVVGEVANTSNQTEICSDNCFNI
jgi:hypothetical protein